MNNLTNTKGQPLTFGLRGKDGMNEVKAKEVKFAKTVTKREWYKAPKDYKTVIDGVHYMLLNGGEIGTVLAPVEIIEAEVNEKDDAIKYHTS